MRAVVHDRYGPPEVLRLEEVERPVLKEGEILIRIRAATVNRTECHIRRADPFFWRFFSGLRRPRQRILGSELAGEVAAVGEAVTEFAVGDHVFGISGRFGTHAEFICLPQSAKVAHKPAGMSFEEAAAVCDGGLSALGFSEWRISRRAGGSSSTERRERSAPPPFSSPGTSAATSQRCAPRRTSS